MKRSRSGTPVRPSLDVIPFDILINSILPFVGVGQYAFVAPTSNKMRQAYQACFPERETHLSEVVTSVSRTQIALLDPDFGSLVSNSSKLSDAAARVGNVKVLQWIQSQGDLQASISTSTHVSALKCNQLDALNF